MIIRRIAPRATTEPERLAKNACAITGRLSTTATDLARLRSRRAPARPHLNSDPVNDWLQRGVRSRVYGPVKSTGEGTARMLVLARSSTPSRQQLLLTARGAAWRVHARPPRAGPI